MELLLRKRVGEVTLYRKRPIEVHAIKWIGESPAAIGRFLQDHALEAKAEFVRHGALAAPPELVVTTVDKNMVTVPIGAYLVIDSKGYPYPCDAEIFESGHDDASVPSLLDRLAEHVARNGILMLAYHPLAEDHYGAATCWGDDGTSKSGRARSWSTAPTLEDAIELEIA